MSHGRQVRGATLDWQAQDAVRRLVRVLARQGSVPAEFGRALVKACRKVRTWAAMHDLEEAPLRPHRRIKRRQRRSRT